jgi:hypothetical protein
MGRWAIRQVSLIDSLMAEDFVSFMLRFDFGILRCLVGARIMVNENHFRFDRKSFFNFWKTIYGFKNRKSFFEIILFVLSCTFDI